MISELIKAIGRECELTQQQLADVMGVNLQRVKNLSGGYAGKLKREESEALVKKLHIRAEWLVTGDGPMFQTAAEVELQRRLDVVGKATRQAVAMYLRPEQTDLLQRITMAVETGDSATLGRLLRPLSEREAKLLEHYAAMCEDDRRALERVAGGMAPIAETVRPSAREIGPDPDRGSQPRIIGEKTTTRPAGKTRKRE